METNIGHPTQDLLSVVDIHTLLPQQEPFVMVGSIKTFDTKKIVTELHIAKDNIFVDDGSFGASGLIENIAQTCAVRIGYINKFILKKEIQLGFIGAIRNLHITGQPRVGDTIETTVVVEEEVFGMVLASATICCKEKILVTAEIKIATKKSV